MGLTIQRPSVSFGACPEALRGSVRLYEPEYGRFLSTDVLWGKYLPLQPYQYAGNNPVAIVDPTGMAGEDPKEAERVSSTVSLGAAVAGVALGTFQVVAGVTAIATPTGIGQIGGAALVANGIGMICFSGGKTIDAVNAIANDGPVSDIPSGYEELAGGAIERALGGDGQTGELVGGIVFGAATGGVATKALQIGAKAAPLASLPSVLDGLPGATGGLEFISTTHAIGTATGVIKQPVSEKSSANPGKDERFQSVLIEPNW
jgi:hypothetical protein